MRHVEYSGMSYQQASNETMRVMARYGVQRGWDRLLDLREIMERHLRNGKAR